MAKGGSILKSRFENTSNTIEQSYDEMFSSHIYMEGKIVELNIADLKPHPKDPFKPYSEDKLMDLAKSIEKIGLLNAIIVRPHTNGGYEILAGKNRTNATAKNGSKKINAVIKDVDDDTAIMILTDSNLKNREELLPSEKGWAYRMQVEIRNKQGKRTDLAENSTLVHGEQKTSRLEVAELNNVKESIIQRYIRITYLLPELLEQVDSRKIYLMAGYNFSYLGEQSQLSVLEYYQESDFKLQISIKLSEMIRSEYDKNNTSLTLEQIEHITSGKKDKPTKTFSVSRSKFKAYSEKLPNDAELEKLFLEFLYERFGDISRLA